MKIQTLLRVACGALAIASLSACVAYEVPYRDGGEHRSNRGDRDRDGDGVPNRVDRDRDGDGVRNREDRRPNDPNRY